MSAPASRPVHPCILSLTKGSRGAEFATWAHITSHDVPNLVTASASTLHVYSFTPDGTLRFEHFFGNLAGEIIFLTTLSGTGKDALLVGFAGPPRLTVLTIQEDRLRAESLVDLTTLLTQYSHGASVEEDMMVSVQNQKPMTVACNMGGGIAVAVMEIHSQAESWYVTDPYVLPLATLSRSSLSYMIDTPASTATTGFGDILGVTFLSGFLEATLVLLHSDPAGKIWSGRLGREKGQGSATPLYLTALSVSVVHNRAAVLWCRPVPNDALYVEFVGNALVVVGANTLVFLDCIGNVNQVMAVNGWARSTCPASLMSAIAPNPVLKLSLQLDGSCLTALSSTTAILSLRAGQLYILQYAVDAWTMLPLGQSLGSVGEVALLTSLPMEGAAKELLSKVQSSADSDFSLGLLFAGSRLGDSLLLGYALETKSLSMKSIKQELHASLSIKSEVNNDSKLENDEADSEYERILRLEEEALYAPVPMGDSEPHLIQPSDNEDDENDVSANPRKKPRLISITLVRALTPLDMIVNLGPLGPSCIGPLSKAPDFLLESLDTTTQSPDSIFGATAHIFPCGFGSSGGLAVATVFGRDDRMILSEHDCVDVVSMFSAPTAGYLLLGISPRGGGGTTVLKVSSHESNEDLFEFREVDTDELIDGGIVFNSAVLGTGEFTDGHFAVCVKQSDEAILRLLIFDKSFRLRTESFIDVKFEGSISSLTPFVQQSEGDEQTLTFGCLWTSGEATVVVCSKDGITSILDVGETTIDSSSPVPMEVDDDDPEETRRKEFYASKTIVGLDVFVAPSSTFPSFELNGNGMERIEEKRSSLQDFENQWSIIDEEDELLYSAKSRTAESLRNARDVSCDESVSTEEKLFVAVCRQSSALEVYAADGGKLRLCWQSFGCGPGTDCLKFELPGEHRLPSTTMVCVKELRFFLIGASYIDKNPLSRTLCFAVETSAGDVIVYQKSRNDLSGHPISFHKVDLGVAGRRSKEQNRHNAKLSRKKVLSRQEESEIPTFSTNALHRVTKLSGQDGCFIAGYRPMWIIAERGAPSYVLHRTRHAAPAGGTDKPLRAYCAGFFSESSQDSGFVTLHERVGKVGSQRITLFRGLSSGFENPSIISGSGTFIEKVPMGVTIRHIEFIDDPSISSGSHPLYAVLVSKEFEADQSEWNTDTLAAEERRALEEEKEQAMIQKQVEADLGGFDIHSEWVEEIDRENCFDVDLGLGGAPPVRNSAYSLWLVDAAKGWTVVDSFELAEYEHGMALKVMSLSDMKVEPGSASAELEEETDFESTMFIAVGTGIVNHNGEDVSSKGRALLFTVTKKLDEVAELKLRYEKEVFHGPVTTLECLSIDGKNRLVVGAGADINIEQWGNDRLTQVGFFRATMEVSNIQLFKNFFLLSDAYDSLYFLVWRESDKSLTLLAKDYDPIPVYAAGLMSRGPNMTIVCHDDRQNLTFVQYAPGEAAARGGNKLVCRADCHIGHQTTCFKSHQCRSSLIIHSATPISSRAALKQQDTFFGRADDDQRLAVHYGTTDGTMASIVPISEPLFWRLTALQSVMANALDADCALNPRGWRLYRRTPRRGGCRSNYRKKSVIDGDLVMRFVDLPVAEQEDLAASIGSTVDLIFDNLLEIQCGSMIL
ncbi:cleavage and polyadenylation specificity factor subunit 1 [Fistulifera solaris]|uniref:Cleavage and polyadenylation specificity factor subunit 1 n=1 Tax=Fistulifera solaris TaxID=1519565 RepID=A0A1Z5JKK1_FISSO|nr:cleavage and polyadenylation specificity factor subunit 1 [Fistulifera solaris]|eukprot:GAX14519.1 cleavage and polyadenylation specificity factor subunit 1 [Fistulifera solaris]